jgi:endonuclease YncB( thermonuclease family)
MRFFVACLTFLLFASIAHADITGKARVVDGDTIHINQTKIRLHGIDAPEMDEIAGGLLG